MKRSTSSSFIPAVIRLVEADLIGRDVGHPPPFIKDGVVIISGDGIDDATQEIIRNALEAAGEDGEIRFVDRETSGGPHHVKIIRKKAELKQ